MPLKTQLVRLYNPIPLGLHIVPGSSLTVTLFDIKNLENISSVTLKIGRLRLLSLVTIPSPVPIIPKQFIQDVNPYDVILRNTVYKNSGIKIRLNNIEVYSGTLDDILNLCKNVYPCTFEIEFDPKILRERDNSIEVEFWSRARYTNYLLIYDTYFTFEYPEGVEEPKIENIRFSQAGWQNPLITYMQYTIVMMLYAFLLMLFVNMMRSIFASLR